MRSTIRAGAVCLLLASAAVNADQFEDGLAAWNRGDYATALELWRPLADQGLDKAQYNLGIMYQEGRGVPQDYAVAMDWYRKAADQGYAAAQGNLGQLYWYGKGVRQDHAEAVKWVRKGAEQGDSESQEKLGEAYLLGKGVKKDYSEAAAWFRKAAEQHGNVVALNNLGALYDRGWGVPKDHSKAVALYRAAAERGYGLAQQSLGRMYAIGEGVSEDLVQSYFWITLANEQQVENSSQMLAELDAIMTPAEIAEARKLAREWKPTKVGAGPVDSKPLSVH